MGRCRLAFALLVFAAPAAGQPLAEPKLAGEDRALADRIAAADRNARDKKPDEALNEYQQILSEAGDALVPLDRAGTRCVQARRLCHARIAALPAQALRRYRDRVDPQTKKWLEQGTAERDPAPLRRLVEEAFCSTFGDRALDLLGDLAFERGDFDEAETWWYMLAPCGKAVGDALVYPDPGVEIARVRAKLLLARLFHGERFDLGSELEALRKAYPKAEGVLAGRRGNYADLVGQLAAAPLIKQRGTSGEGDEGMTFASIPSRNQVLANAPGRLEQLRPLEAPLHRIRLAVEDKEDEPAVRVLPPAEKARSLAFHPVVFGDQVLVADARRLTAFDLRDGRRVTFDLFADRKRDPMNLRLQLPAEPDLRYTLTVVGDRVYARFGVQALGVRRRDDSEVADSYLFCLRLVRGADNRPARWEEQWKRRAEAPLAFEGTPVVQAGRAYIAESRMDEAGQTQSSVVCYDAETGALHWSRPVAVAKEFKPADRRVRHHLLALAGPHVVYATHAGAVVALDGQSGKVVWAVRYASRGPKTAEGEPSQRDLAPCIYHGGRVYAAPADLDRILCLDAVTGRQLWESSSVEVVHLLGVARGRLIFTVTSPRPFATGLSRGGIRALDAVTGAAQPDWDQPSEGDLPSFGRGFLAGDYVYWPTAHGLRVLSQATGEPPRALEWRCACGNLAAGNGYLVVASTEELIVYGPDAENPRPSPPAPLLQGERGEAGSRVPGERDLRVFDEVSMPATLEEKPVARSLVVPLTRAWEAALTKDETGAGERLLVPDEGSRPHDIGRLFFARGAGVVCRDAATGRVCWARPLPDMPLWVGCRAGVVLAGGAAAVHGLRLGDGERIWELSGLQLSETPAGPTLGTFRLAGPRLFFFQGECRLFAAEAMSGRLLWARWAPGAQVRPAEPAGRFQPHYYAGIDWLLVQTSGGKRLTLDARNGRAVFIADADPTPWPRPPLAFDERQLGLAVSPRRVVRLDVASGKELWSYELDGVTGEPICLVGAAGVLLLVVPKNYGWELHRLDPSTGRPLWNPPRPHSPHRIGAESVAADEAAVYFVAHNRLHAYGLSDGRPLWQRDLPLAAGSWRVVYANKAVMVCPTAAVRPWHGEEAIVSVFAAAHPAGVLTLMRKALSVVRNDLRQGHLAVFVYASADGRLLQRFDFTANGPWSGIVIGGGRMTAALGSWAWGLTQSGRLNP